MIGIGITTYKREPVLEKCLSQIYANTDMGNIKLYIARDSDADRRGVAFRKNECLRELKGCSDIFLFDDDCYPINPNWVNFFCQTPHQHLLFCIDKLHGIPYTKDELLLYNSCGGVFMYLKPSAINRVGAFNENYGLYGCEHVDYSFRVMGGELYPVLKDTEQYIYAEDYYDWRFQSGMDNKEKTNAIKGALATWMSKEKFKDYIPL